MKQFRVHFDGRVLVPEGPVDLPVNEVLEVRVVGGAGGDFRETDRAEARGSDDQGGGKPLSKVAAWAKELPEVEDDLPSDVAAQHDHYLYGTPKRS